MTFLRAAAEPLIDRQMTLTIRARASRRTLLVAWLLALTVGAVAIGGLWAADSQGRPLRSWLELHDRELLPRVDTHDARYPLTIDPLIQQGGKLVGAKEESAGEFGTRVALSANGNTALVGSPNDTGGKGAAWVFVRTGSTWIEDTKLTNPSEEDKEKFGFSVALSADGNTAVIGGPGYSNNKGAAWTFKHLGTSWVERDQLTVSAVQDEGRFGAGVALSADATTILVGAPKHASLLGGAAWAFVRLGPPVNADYSQQGPELIVEFGPVEGTFGESLALSSDGDTAVIGSPGTNLGQGKAYVYTRSEGAWSLSQTLEGEGEEGEEGGYGGLGEFRFGESVALSADGSIALVGAPEDNNRVGAVWTYVRSGSNWAQQGEKLRSSGEVGEGNFGASLGFSADGETALIGAPGDDLLGSARVYARSGSSWIPEGERLTGTGESGPAHFGSAVALSADGGTALVGGPLDNHGVGAAWAYVTALPPSVVTGAASNVYSGTATLNGTVNPNELSTTSYFEYGVTDTYGQSTTVQDVGSAGAVSLEAEISGLSPETTYHYRIVANSQAGTSDGSDQIFTTAPAMVVPVAPVSIGAPLISGTPVRGQALSVSQGSWLNGPTSFEYQWQSCGAAVDGCAPLRGAIGAAHSLSQADVGRRLRAVVTGVNAGGRSSVTSAASSVVGSQVEAAMTWTFGWLRGFTAVEALVVHELPAGGTVEVVCSGRGCPFAHDHVASTVRHPRCAHSRCKKGHPLRAQSEVNLAPLFKGRHMAAGARIVVNIVRAGWIGKSYMFTMRNNHAPRVRVACVALGSKRPGDGC
jgi:hypothetical protein